MYVPDWVHCVVCWWVPKVIIHIEVARWGISIRISYSVPKKWLSAGLIYNDFGWCRSWQKKRRKRDVCGKVGQYYALEQKNRKPRAAAAKLTQCTILTNFVSHKYFQMVYKEDTKLPYMMDFSIWYPVVRQSWSSQRAAMLPFFIWQNSPNQGYFQP